MSEDTQATAAPAAEGATAQQEPFIADSDLPLIRQGVANGYTDDQFNELMHQAYRTGLNPLDGQIRLHRLGGDVFVVVTRPGLLVIAERTGRYGGKLGPLWCDHNGEWRDVWLTPGVFPRAAKAGIIRHDFAEPCWEVAHWADYASRDQGGNTTGIWAAKPLMMLADCAIGLAVRSAFPWECSKLYTPEELTEKFAPAPAAPAPVYQPQPAAAPAQQVVQPAPQPAMPQPAPVQQQAPPAANGQPNWANYHQRPPAYPGQPAPVQQAAPPAAPQMAANGAATPVAAPQPAMQPAMQPGTRPPLQARVFSFNGQEEAQYGKHGALVFLPSIDYQLMPGDAINVTTKGGKMIPKIVVAVLNKLKNPLEQVVAAESR